MTLRWIVQFSFSPGCGVVANFLWNYYTLGSWGEYDGSQLILISCRLIFLNTCFEGKIEKPLLVFLQLNCRFLFQKRSRFFPLYCNLNIATLIHDPLPEIPPFSHSSIPIAVSAINLESRGCCCCCCCIDTKQASKSVTDKQTWQTEQTASLLSRRPSRPTLLQSRSFKILLTMFRKFLKLSDILILRLYNWKKIGQVRLPFIRGPSCVSISK